MKKGKLLSQAMNEKCKDCPAKLYNKLKHPLQPKMLCFFSDEKKLYQDLMVNSHSNRWLALSSQNVSVMMKTKHPVHIMMFEMVISNVNIMPPFIYPHGAWLNTETYIKYLEEVMLFESRGWAVKDPFRVKYIYVCVSVSLFNDISTFVRYLMPKLFS